MAESLPTSGPIDPKSFPFTLVAFYRQGATGSLKVEGENHQKALYFRGGRVLFGSSNDPKDQLGAILIESGKITEQQLEDVNQKVGPGNPLAKALSDSGVVSQRELSEAARAKVERILSDVLSYASGKFEFEDGVLPKGAIDLKLAPERLFLAAVRRVNDRTFVLRHIEGLDVMLSAKPELQEKMPEIESEVAGLPDHFDGLTNLKEAAGRAAIDEFEAAKIACGLLFLGLAEKSGAMVVGGDEESPLFVPAQEGAELDLGQSSDPVVVDESPAIAIGGGGASMESEAPIVIDAPPPAAAPETDATLVMGELPSFTLPSMSSPPAPPPPPPASAARPSPEPESSGGPAPLKIIAPPKPAERTRPPAKPSKEDLAALDELLGKRSPEGPLTPIQKPTEEWKPTFLPERPSSRGKKQDNSGRSKLIVGVGTAVVAAAVAAGGWVLWSNRANGASQRAALAPIPSASPLASATSLPGASPSAIASVPAPAPSAPASAAVASARPSAPPTALASTVPTTLPAAVPSPPKAAAATPAPKPSASAPPKAAEAGASLDEARGLLRKGRFDEAARGFQSHLKSNKASHSVQILLACSTDTLQKAVNAVQAGELYVLPVHYKGKDCYRVGWGLYESEAKATAGARGVPDYFRQGGARPKVVALSELLQ